MYYLYGLVMKNPSLCPQSLVFTDRHTANLKAIAHAGYLHSRLLLPADSAVSRRSSPRFSWFAVWSYAWLAVDNL